MQITLMRHGKPRLSSKKWVTPAGMRQWIDHYNLSDIEIDAIPPECMAAAASARVIATSNLARAKASIRALGHIASTEDALFAEAELPHALWRAPHLPPNIWAIFFRVLWMLGYSRGAISLVDTRHRARAAAQQLIVAAGQGPVLLVGHGIMNRLIGKELLASGWIASTTHNSRYWGMGAYGKPAGANAAVTSA
jgi:broad specificity phosphatase PhoE